MSRVSERRDSARRLRSQVKFLPPHFHPTKPFSRSILVVSRDCEEICPGIAHILSRCLKTASTGSLSIQHSTRRGSNIERCRQFPLTTRVAGCKELSRQFFSHSTPATPAFFLRLSSCTVCAAPAEHCRRSPGSSHKSLLYTLYAVFCLTASFVYAVTAIAIAAA